MFYIRADGNEKIGMGHIMRCTAIAEALRKRGEEVIFVTAEENPVAIIKKRSFTEKPKILVDSYFITHRYLEQLGEVAKVILMDDEKKAVYPCDALVNYNIFGKTLGYGKDYPEETKLFLGCEYAPLREEFRNCGYEVRETVEHILFTTGGSDSCHIALAVAKRFGKKNHLPEHGGKPPIWHIVCGPYHPDTEELERLAAQNGRLRIHKNVTRMSELMQSCDIAVSSAGSTLYELCSVGIPTVGFYFVDNQQKNMETFAELTPMKNAGDYAAEPERVLDLIEKEVEKLCGEKMLREKISKSMRTVVDGRGADRLAEAFLSL